MEWKVTELPKLKGFTIEWAEPGNYILSRRNQLFRSNSLEPPFTLIATIHAPSWKSLASRSRLAQRLLRFMVTNVVKLKNGELFVTFDKSVGVVRDGRYKHLEGLIRPCRVLRSACAVDREENIYFGEYLANEERGEVHVYKYTLGRTSLEIVQTFPTNSIRHIHGVYFDEFTDSLVCLTGDDKSECRMIRTSDGFKTTEVIGEGDESWRAVSILFAENEFYYGTDAEYRANEIVQVDRSNLARTTLGEVTGTVFYSKLLGNDLFFTTTAENAPSQKENVAALWRVGLDGSFEQIAKFQKDRWHGTLFLFGTIHFPYANTLNDKLYFSLVGVNGDNRTYCISAN